MTYTCPLCGKREKIQCVHSRVARHGYFNTDGKFYLSDSKGMRKDAESINFNPEPFFETKL